MNRTNSHCVSYRAKGIVTSIGPTVTVSYRARGVMTSTGLTVTVSATGQRV